MIFPRMFRIKQALEGPVIFDVLRTIHDNLQSLNLQHQVKNGQAVAITAGSRGITGIAKILKSIVGATVLTILFYIAIFDCFSPSR